MTFDLQTYPKQSAQVHGSTMRYVDVGHGDPIVFLHGNPTSSFLWRNIIPHVQSMGRCIAPDLIGMGDSDKLPDANADAYSFQQHFEYLDTLLEQLDLGENVILVIHDWGSALGFYWATRHRARVKGIAYMEAIVQPVSWADWPEAGRNIFQLLRSDVGEDLILNKNIFVERILPGSILRPLQHEEMAAYREPFKHAGEDRRPTLTWPRQIPIEGEPQDMVEIVEGYGHWLADSNDLPKLFINADPGSILVGKPREFCRSWPNQIEIIVKGLHFIQEDSPDEIGTAIADFVRSVRAGC